MQVAAKNIGGQIVEDAAIDQVVAVAVLNRGKDAGNGDGGAHGLGQRPGGESDWLQGAQVGGHAAEGDGEAVVVQLLAVVAEEVGGEEFVDAAVGEQSVAQGDAVTDADSDRLGNLAAVLTAAKAGVGIGRLQGEDAGKGVADGDGAQFGGGAAGGVNSPYQRAHAGAGDAVDGDAVILEPLEDTDVGQSQGAATFKRNADRGPVGRCDGRQGGYQMRWVLRHSSS
jgi:hypothetical protein